MTSPDPAPGAKAAGLSPGVELQPQQRRVADRVAAGGDLLVYHQVGAGKSLAGIAAAEGVGGPYAFVSPAALRENTRKELAKFTDGSSPAEALSYEQAARGGGPAGGFGTLVVDECMPAGTLVDGRPIETIRAGDSVVAFDHATGRIGRRTVERTASRLTSDIVVVRMASGRRIACTPNHPFFTLGGYVPAEDLRRDDVVFRLADRRGDGPEEPTDAEDDGADLPELREVVRRVRPPLQGPEALLRGMPPGRLVPEHGEGATRPRRGNSDAHGRGESDAGSRLPGEGGGDPPPHRARAEGPGGKRDWADSPGIGDGRGPGLADGRRRGDAEAPAGAPPLQAGRRGSGVDDRRRDRRGLAQFAVSAGAGREEGRVLVRDRVEGVSLHQRGSGPEFERLCPGGVVFDLTVEGCHNFFADGYLVHNSHNLRNPASARHKAVADMARRARRRVLLTGTPIVNSPGDLAGPLSILAGEPISPEEFERRFVGREKVRPGLWARLRGVEPAARAVVKDVRGLERLLRGRVDYHAPAEAPVRSREERIEVPLASDQAAVHRLAWGRLPWATRWKLTRDYPLTKAEIANLGSFMTGPRQASLSMLPYMRRGEDPLAAFGRSPKLRRAVEELEKELAGPGGKALVFSNFIDAGLAPYSAALAARGVPHGVFRGGISDADRKRMVADYNAGRLRALLLGPAGSEGLSTKETTLIQQLDPHWNPVREQQNKGRGIRFDSHSDLPPELRDVRVQRFIAAHPRGALDRLLRRRPRPTADEVLERMSAEKRRLNESFLEVLRRVGSEKAAALDPPAPPALAPVLAPEDVVADHAGRFAAHVGRAGVTGLLAYLAYRSLRPSPPKKRPAEKAAAGPAVGALLAAKAMSDRRDYKGKHAVMRRMLAERPDEFFVDDPKGWFLGISHRPSGFRLHLPRSLVPAAIEGFPGAPDVPAAVAAKAASIAALDAAINPPPGRRRPAAPPRPKPRPRRPAPATEGPPVEDVLEAALGAVRRRRAAGPWEAVPAKVAAAVRSGDASDLEGAAPWSPDALALAIARGAGAVRPRVDLSALATLKAARERPSRETVRLGGLTIKVEYREGDLRSGKSDDGTPWSRTMRDAYGRIEGARGADGEALDCFLGPGRDPKADVYLVEQVDPEGGEFDEHKAMLGYGSEAEAERAYLRNFPEGWGGLGSIRAMSPAEFEAWARPSKEASGRPEACTCPDYPRVRMRNGSGHAPGCPVHEDWKAAGGFFDREAAAAALRRHEAGRKEASDGATGLFTPSIPVDAFNQVVWNDAWGAGNAFGARPAHGTAESPLGTSPQVAAAVSGVLAGAGAARGSDRVSPWDVAAAAGAAAGKGWLGGLVLGRTVGALAGLPPESQSKLRDAGLWGGLLAGAVRATFGGK